MAGMKVFLTEEKELIMEPSLKWAGNPNIKIAAKAYGLKATVQVVGYINILEYYITVLYMLMYLQFFYLLES